MTKTELISAMAAECGLSKTDAGKALDAFMLSCLFSSLQKMRLSPLLPGIRQAGCQSRQTQS